MPYIKSEYSIEFDRVPWQELKWRRYVVQIHRSFLFPAFHKERIGTFKPHWIFQFGPLVIGGGW